MVLPGELHVQLTVPWHFLLCLRMLPSMGVVSYQRLKYRIFLYREFIINLIPVLCFPVDVIFLKRV